MALIFSPGIFDLEFLFFQRLYPLTQMVNISTFSLHLAFNAARVSAFHRQVADLRK
jgi:hypothetical protein